MEEDPWKGFVGVMVLEITATDLNRGSLFISKTGILQGVDVVFAPTDVNSSTNFTLFSLKGWFKSMKMWVKMTCVFQHISRYWFLSQKLLVR